MPRRAKLNPLGLQVDAQLVRVGQGKHTHLYNPRTRLHACRSGVNAGRGGPSGAIPELHPVDSRRITCYRCAKLAQMNMDEHGSPVPR